MIIFILLTAFNLCKSTSIRNKTDDATPDVTDLVTFQSFEHDIEHIMKYDMEHIMKYDMEPDKEHRIELNLENGKERDT